MANDNTIALDFKPWSPEEPTKVLNSITSGVHNLASADNLQASSEKTRALLPGELTQQGLTAEHTRATTAHTNALSQSVAVTTLDNERKLHAIEAYRKSGHTQADLEALAGEHPEFAQHLSGALDANRKYLTARDVDTAARNNDWGTVNSLAPAFGEQKAKLDKTLNENAQIVRQQEVIRKAVATGDYSEIAEFPDLMAKLSKEQQERAQTDKIRADTAKTRAETANIAGWNPAGPGDQSLVSAPPPARAPATPAPALPGGSPNDSGPAPASEANAPAPAAAPPVAAPQKAAVPHPEMLPQDPGKAATVQGVAEGKLPLASVPAADQMKVLESVGRAYGNFDKLDTGKSNVTMFAGKGPSPDNKDQSVDGTYAFDHRAPVGTPPTWFPNVVQTTKTSAVSPIPNAETLDRIATQVVERGDYSGTKGMGRSAAAMTAINDAITAKMKQMGKTPSDITTMTADLAGQMAGERALGSAEARIGMAVQSARVLMPQVLQTSEKVSRYDYPDFNKILLAAKEKTGDPNVVRFAIAVQSFANAYGGVMSRGSSVVTDSQREHAYAIMKTAWSKGQISGAMDQLGKEIVAEMKAPGLEKQVLRGKIPEIHTKEDFEMLLPGMDFIWNGQKGKR